MKFKGWFRTFYRRQIIFLKILFHEVLSLFLLSKFLSVFLVVFLPINTSQVNRRYGWAYNIWIVELSYDNVKYKYWFYQLIIPEFLSKLYILLYLWSEIADAQSETIGVHVLCLTHFCVVWNKKKFRMWWTRK